jgi:hypothetical protein
MRWEDLLILIVEYSCSDITHSGTILVPSVTFNYLQLTWEGKKYTEHKLCHVAFYKIFVRNVFLPDEYLAR